jgi:hypothetical protein
MPFAQEPGCCGELCLPLQTSSKFSLRIWLDKPTVSDHRNSVKLQTLSFPHGEPYPTSYAALGARRADVGKHGRVNYPPA